MEWISVEDRLPPMYVSVLVYPEPSFSYSDELTAWFNGVKWEVGCEDSYTQYNEVYEGVTHWMPLPEPPKDQDDD